jgi:hypothetical protein
MFFYVYARVRLGPRVRLQFPVTVAMTREFPLKCSLDLEEENPKPSLHPKVTDII